MNKISNFFSSEYLLSINNGTNFESVYLYLSLFLVLAILGLKIFLRFKTERPEVLKKFDRAWFWGYFTLGFVGIFIWFSRTQALPIFSTRLMSYLWILILIIFTGYVFYLFKSKAPKELSKYYEKKRKQKYLK